MSGSGIEIRTCDAACEIADWSGEGSDPVAAAAAPPPTTSVAATAAALAESNLPNMDFFSPPARAPDEAPAAMPVESATAATKADTTDAWDESSPVVAGPWAARTKCANG